MRNKQSTNWGCFLISSSSSSFDGYLSFSSFNTVSSFLSAAVNSYSALIKEFHDDARGSQVSCLTTNSAQIKESTFPMTNRELSAAADAVEQLQNPTSSLAATGHQSDIDTFSSLSFRAFKNFVFDNKKDERCQNLYQACKKPIFNKRTPFSNCCITLLKLSASCNHKANPWRFSWLDRLISQVMTPQPNQMIQMTASISCRRKTVILWKR